MEDSVFCLFRLRVHPAPEKKRFGIDSTRVNTLQQAPSRGFQQLDIVFSIYIVQPCEV